MAELAPSDIGDLKRTINDCVAVHWRELSKKDLATAVSDINLLNEALIVQAVQSDARQAGEQSIDLGSVTLKLGMPKDTVISHLAAPIRCQISSGRGRRGQRCVGRS